MKQMTAICLALALVFGALANKQGLVVLSIDGNAITDISPLAGNERLDNLSMRGNQVTDLNPLATVPQLTSLMISGNPIQTYDQLESSYAKITQTDYELLFAGDIPDTPLVFADAAFEKALRTAMGIFDRRLRKRMRLPYRSFKLTMINRRARSLPISVRCDTSLTCAACP